MEAWERACLNPNCGQKFMPGRIDQYTCSTRCRVALYRLRKRLKTHNIEAMPPHVRQMLEELRGVSERSYRRVLAVVERDGAGVAEQVVYGAYEAAHDCITYVQIQQSSKG